MKRLDRYIFRQILVPLTITLSIAALLLVLERMLRLFDFVVNQGGPVDVVFEMLANLMPHYMGLALPVGVFLGVMMAFRSLSLSSEYEVATSAGQSLLQLLRPALLTACLCAAINVALTGWIQPYSRYTYRELVFELRSGALGASIRVGDYVTIGKNVVLRVDGARNNGQILEGVFVERRWPDRTLAVSAESGQFFATPDRDAVLLRLFNGTSVELNRDHNLPRVLQFDQQDLNIDLPEAATFRQRGGQERELTLIELYTEQNNGSRPPEERQAITAQFHWRIMHSLTFFILPFLAAPLGLTNHRNPRATGIVFGLGLLVVYNEVMEVMQSAVADGASPWTTIWLLYVLFATFAFWVFSMRAFRSGGDPLLIIDAVWDKTASPLVRGAKKLLGVG